MCHTVCSNVILLCHQITYLWFCSKRFYKKIGVLLGPGPVFHRNIFSWTVLDHPSIKEIEKFSEWPRENFPSCLILCKEKYLEYWLIFFSFLSKLWDNIDNASTGLSSKGWKKIWGYRRIQFFSSFRSNLTLVHKTYKVSICYCCCLWGFIILPSGDGVGPDMITPTEWPKEKRKGKKCWRIRTLRKSWDFSLFFAGEDPVC